MSKIGILVLKGGTKLVVDLGENEIIKRNVQLQQNDPEYKNIGNYENFLHWW